MEEKEERLRSLASIQRIVALKPIPEADRIECATVLGWECVVKKGEFKVGDLGVYFEIDSLVPEIPTFEFLRSKKFRVKTCKMKGQLAQGLMLPMSLFPDLTTIEGTDVTDVLGGQEV